MASKNDGIAGSFFAGSINDNDGRGRVDLSSSPDGDHGTVQMDSTGAKFGSDGVNILLTT